MILDTAARQNALTTGSVDVIDAIGPKTAHLMARVSGVRIQEVTGNWTLDGAKSPERRWFA